MIRKRTDETTLWFMFESFAAFYHPNRRFYTLLIQGFLSVKNSIRERERETKEKERKRETEKAREWKSCSLCEPWLILTDFIFRWNSMTIPWHCLFLSRFGAIGRILIRFFDFYGSEKYKWAREWMRVNERERKEGEGKFIRRKCSLKERNSRSRCESGKCDTAPVLFSLSLSEFHLPFCFFLFFLHR